MLWADMPTGERFHHGADGQHATISYSVIVVIDQNRMSEDSDEREAVHTPYHPLHQVSNFHPAPDEN